MTEKLNGTVKCFLKTKALILSQVAAKITLRILALFKPQVKNLTEGQNVSFSVIKGKKRLEAQNVEVV